MRIEHKKSQVGTQSGSRIGRTIGIINNGHLGSTRAESRPSRLSRVKILFPKIQLAARRRGHSQRSLNERNRHADAGHVRQYHSVRSGGRRDHVCHDDVCDERDRDHGGGGNERRRRPRLRLARAQSGLRAGSGVQRAGDGGAEARRAARAQPQAPATVDGVGRQRPGGAGRHAVRAAGGRARAVAAWYTAVLRGARRAPRLRRRLGVYRRDDGARAISRSYQALLVSKASDVRGDPHGAGGVVGLGGAANVRARARPRALLLARGGEARRLPALPQRDHHTRRGVCGLLRVLRYPAVRGAGVLQLGRDSRAVRDQRAAGGERARATPAQPKQLPGAVGARPPRATRLQRRHRGGGGLQPSDGHALRALYDLLAAADGYISAVSGTRAGGLAGTRAAGTRRRRADAAKLRAGSSTIRAAAPTSSVFRFALQSAALLQSTGAQNLDGVDDENVLSTRDFARE